MIANRWYLTSTHTHHVLSHMHTNPAYELSHMHTNPAYQLHTAPSHHSSNPNPRLLSCPLSGTLYCSVTLHFGVALSIVYLLDKLQRVQNAAARLVCKLAKKSDHIHPILQTLHWLPGTHCIQYNILTIYFNSISGTYPQYLSELLQPYVPD